ncbi:MAG: hypothetical protein ACREVE_11905 [Gammaproteobacteria bacterium]
MPSEFSKLPLSLTMSSAAVVSALAATSASAWQNPLEEKYLTKPLQVCDQGVFYVGGAPKMTPFRDGPTPGPNDQLMIGQMYVEFQTPQVSKAWPIIHVHGSGFTGSCVRGTAGGNEGWSDYTLRHGYPTFVVDQAGRGRSGFDHTVIHEAEYLAVNGDVAGAADLLPPFGGMWGSEFFGRFYGHIVPPEANNDPTLGQMIRFGEPGDPWCPEKPAHCNGPIGRIPMEPEAPWAVDQAIKSRTGNGAPAGLGTVTPDNAQVEANAVYLALDAYKFDVPNSEATLPGSECPRCSNPELNATVTWTPRALAELIEGLGGAVLAVHSQGGQILHHTVRVLKKEGNLDLLKGALNIEGFCSLEDAGNVASDFKNIPYLALMSDIIDDFNFPTFTQGCLDTVNAINAAGGKAKFIDLDEPGWWQGSYTGPWGKEYVGPFAGTAHMLMLESNPSPTGQASNLQVMDVILKWANRNISKPKKTTCGQINNRR